MHLGSYVCLSRSWEGSSSSLVAYIRENKVYCIMLKFFIMLWRIRVL